MDHVISHEIKSLPAITMTLKTIVMDSFKESLELPLQTYNFPLQ